MIKIPRQSPEKRATKSNTPALKDLINDECKAVTKSTGDIDADIEDSLASIRKLRNKPN